MCKQASTKSRFLTLDRANAALIAKFFVVCDQENTAPAWGYILHQRDLRVNATSQTVVIDKRLFRLGRDRILYALKQRFDIQPFFQFRPLKSLADIQ